MPKDEAVEKEKMTPEEKLFRVIAAGGKDEIGWLSEKKTARQKFEDWRQKAAVSVEDKVLSFRIAWIELLANYLKTAFLVLAGLVLFCLVADLEPGRLFFLSPGARLSQIGAGESPAFFPYWNKDAGEKPRSAVVSAAFPLIKPYVKPPAGASVPEYKLVGISWDEGGKVAMIEVRGEISARFVRENETLTNGASVKTIKDYSVILASGDREWELR